MGKFRAPIYTHFIRDDKDNDLYTCKRCLMNLKAGGGSSNLHKHMQRSHPGIDKYQLYNEEDESYFDDSQQQDETVQQADGHEEREEEPRITTVKVEALPMVAPKRTSSSKFAPTNKAAQHYKSTASRTSTTTTTPSSTTTTTTSLDSSDLPSAKVLRRLKQVNLDQAQLHNGLLQQQFESQQQLHMIEELRREVNQLKRKCSANNNSGYQVMEVVDEEDQLEDEDGLPKFPLYRMQQVDDVEERIANEPEFKERLAVLFKAGREDKVDSIQSWFSNELLVQFTYKEDEDSLTTHRGTELSEIFQLMFSE